MSVQLDRHVRTESQWLNLRTGQPFSSSGGGDGSVTHGRDISAANTGITGAGVSQSSLATITGGVTYSTNGQTITGKLFTDSVTVSADDVTFENCMFTSIGANNFMLRVNGSGCTVDHCTFLPTSGHSSYEGIYTEQTGLTVTRCDISGCENNITTAAGSGDINILECYLHNPVSPDNPSGHHDNIEVYGGATVNIERCRVTMQANETAVINVAPWSSGAFVSDLTISDNYLDGGNYLVLVDLQSQGTGGTIQRTRVLRNDMGGHQNPANHRYWAVSDNDGRGFVETEALLIASPNKILWPTSGSDVNTWVDSSDLSPDLTGQIVDPTP